MEGDISMSYFEHYQENARILKDSHLVVDRYESDSEKNIFPDILSKIENFKKTDMHILDIGCGCSSLVYAIINHVQNFSQKLTLLDGQDMLNRVNCPTNIEKIAGCFPNDTVDKLKNRKFDIIISYAVMHYALADGLLFNFLDSAVELLNDGGEFLLGDIPNYSKKKRFLNTTFGKNFTLNYINKHPEANKNIEVKFSTFEKGILDDSLIFYVLSRYRTMGYDTYVLPQKNGLPFNYTREDILIKKP